jgi:hypothetical protein
VVNHHEVESTTWDQLDYYPDQSGTAFTEKTLLLYAKFDQSPKLIAANGNALFVKRSFILNK